MSKLYIIIAIVVYFLGVWIMSYLKNDYYKYKERKKKWWE